MALPKQPHMWNLPTVPLQRPDRPRASGEPRSCPRRYFGLGRIAWPRGSVNARSVPLPVMLLRKATSADTPPLAQAWFAMMTEGGYLSQASPPGWAEALAAA